MKRLRKLNIIIGDEDAIINVDNVVDKGGKISKRNFDYLSMASRRVKLVLNTTFLLKYFCFFTSYSSFIILNGVGFRK